MAHFSYDGFDFFYERQGRREGAARRPTILIHGRLPARRHHYRVTDASTERLPGFLDGVWT